MTHPQGQRHDDVDEAGPSTERWRGHEQKGDAIWMSTTPLPPFHEPAVVSGHHARPGADGDGDGPVARWSVSDTASEDDAARRSRRAGRCPGCRAGALRRAARSCSRGSRGAIHARARRPRRSRPPGRHLLPAGSSARWSPSRRRVRQAEPARRMRGSSTAYSRSTRTLMATTKPRSRPLPPGHREVALLMASRPAGRCGQLKHGLHDDRAPSR